MRRHHFVTILLSHFGGGRKSTTKAAGCLIERLTTKTMSFDKVQEDIPFTMTARPPLIKAKSDFIARKPLQSIQVNSKADLADGSGSFKTPQKVRSAGFCVILSVGSGRRVFWDQQILLTNIHELLSSSNRQPRWMRGSSTICKIGFIRSQIIFPRKHYSLLTKTSNMKMTSAFRFSLKSHTRKRRSIAPLQEKPVAKASLAEAKIENIEKLELPEVATTSTSSEISECSSLDQQASNEAFRSTAWMDNAEDEDMWTLKRASPVYDDQDEFYQYESPAKRSRSSLDWQDRLSDDIPLVLTLERH